MGRPKKNQEDSDTQTKDQFEENTVLEEQLPQNEQAEISDETNSGSGGGVIEEPEEKPVMIPSKQFVKILKDELDKEKISESIYVAFLASVPKVDWEENYRLMWTSTFRRPAKPKEKPKT